MTELCFVCGNKPNLIGKFLVVGSALSDVMRKIYSVPAVVDTVNVILSVNVGYAGF